MTAHYLVEAALEKLEGKQTVSLPGQRFFVFRSQP